MRGLCASCQHEYPADRLAGYNVRLGVIREAVCHPCLAYYQVDTGANGWFATFLRKLAGKRRSKQRELIQESANVIPFRQSTLYEHLQEEK